MAASFARVKIRPEAREVVTDMTCDASYPAGGYPVAPKDIGVVSAPEAVECSIRSAQGLLAMYDVTAAKVKLFVTGALDAVLNEAGSNDVSTSVLVRIVAKGDPIL